jgi:GTPase SAR1 family protein
VVQCHNLLKRDSKTVQNASAVLIVFDLAEEKSFQAVQEMYSHVATTTQTENFIVVGNKCDLPETTRQVSQEAVEAFMGQASKVKRYFQVSAKDGTNLKEMVDYSVRLSKQTIAAQPASSIQPK